MDRRANGLRYMGVWASDGPIGRVADLLFEDSAWSLRYIVVVSERALGVRTMLVRPHYVESIDDDEGKVYVCFPRSQAAILPDLDADMPVSRQKQVEQGFIASHMPSWGGGGPWGHLFIPSGFLDSRPFLPPKGRPPDPHLRSFMEVKGYKVRREGGPLGRVRDLVFDEEWLIRAVEVQTRGWRAAHRAMVPARLITRISWRRRLLVVSSADAPVRRTPASAGTGDLESGLLSGVGSAELSMGAGIDRGSRVRPGLSGHGAETDDIALNDGP